MCQTTGLLTNCPMSWRGVKICTAMPNIDELLELENPGRAVDTDSSAAPPPEMGTASRRAAARAAPRGDEEDYTAAPSEGDEGDELDEEQPAAPVDPVQAALHSHLEQLARLFQPGARDARSASPALRWASSSSSSSAAPPAASTTRRAPRCHEHQRRPRPRR